MQAEGESERISYRLRSHDEFERKEDVPHQTATGSKLDSVSIDSQSLVYILLHRYRFSPPPAQQDVMEKTVGAYKHRFPPQLLHLALEEVFGKHFPRWPQLSSASFFSVRFEDQRRVEETGEVEGDSGGEAGRNRWDEIFGEHEECAIGLIGGGRHLLRELRYICGGWDWMSMLRKDFYWRGLISRLAVMTHFRLHSREPTNSLQIYADHKSS